MEDDGGWEDRTGRIERNRNITQKGSEFTLENKIKNWERCFQILSALNQQKLLFSSEVKEMVKRVSSERLDKYEEFFLSQDKVVSDEEKIQKSDEYLTNLYKTVNRGLVHKTYQKCYNG